MRLSAHDASFLYTETASGPMHGLTVSVLDGPATWEEVFQFYAERIHLVPRFRQKLAFVPFNVAHPKWVDDDEFDLANHLKRHPVPPNTTVERGIEIALELGEPLLDRARPLWLTYVLEDVEGKTLLVQIAHHAFVDGATLVAMSTVLTTPSADSPPPNAPPPWAPPNPPSPSELWQEAMTENARAGLDQAAQAAQATASFARLGEQGVSLMQRMSRPVMQAPWNASLVGPKRTMAYFSTSLDALKDVRKSLGGTVNDVVVTAVSEGVARYLARKREAVQGRSLRIMCPVDVREDDDDPLEAGGNRVSAMFPLVSAEVLGAAERFAAVRAELDEIKANDEPWVLDQMQRLQPNIPPVAMAQTLSVGTQWDPTALVARAPLPVLPTTGARPQQLGFNFTCTNVPGPNWTQHVAGYRVENTVGTLMLGGNLGLGCGVGSYDGTFNFMFTADPRLVPDVEMLRDQVADVLAELQALATS